MVAVIGVPDALRGEVVKAFVVPRDGYESGPALAADIQAYVKTRLSGHEYSTRGRVPERTPHDDHGQDHAAANCAIGAPEPSRSSSPRR